MKSVAACAISAMVLLSSGALSQEFGVYETTAMLTVEWKMDAGELISTAGISKIEKATSQYFSELLLDPSHTALQDSTTVLETSVNIEKQKNENSYVVLDSSIHVTYTGNKGITDLAGLLMFLISRNTTNSFPTQNATNSSFPTLDALIGLSIEVEMLALTNGGAPIMLYAIGEDEVVSDEKYSDSEKTLIVVSAFLAFALLVLSIILIWIAGGWLALRKQVRVLIHREEELTRMTRQQADELKEIPTASEEDDEESGNYDSETQFTNPSGILGVNPYYGQKGSALDGLGIKMTPSRKGGNDEFSDSDSEIATPMSDATGYSDTDRAPIGITSMRKLLPAVGDQQDDGLNNLANFGVKRLQF